jgi:PAS domain-containing protein
VFKGNPGKLLFRITGLKGTPRWMETHAVPMRDGSGKIAALLAVTRDITDKKETEEELIRNERKYRTLVEQAIDAIALYDANGKLLDVNKTIGLFEGGVTANVLKRCSYRR